MDQRITVTLLLHSKNLPAQWPRSFVRSLRGDYGSSGWYANPQYSAEANYHTAQCASPSVYAVSVGIVWRMS